MTDALNQIQEIDNRLAKVIRWRGVTGTANVMVQTIAITTDEVLKKNYTAQLKDAIAVINKIQENIISELSDPAEKAGMEKIQTIRKSVLTGVGKVRELRSAGDIAGSQIFYKEVFSQLILQYEGHKIL
ncbi:MCP four helix bundle domain-containing protein [Paracidovorax konjaci]|uniref:MCP four helix bundle domain-containing protein n=1 Tax=Paracidovorax konjaci TaxID=32040 RepID=UPI0011140766|nr:hypothetical protein [Paracidovorax konjaci]